MTDNKSFEIHYDEGWAALYVDGKLVTVGDSYNTEEEAFSLLGVKTYQDDAFMRGQTSREGVAQDLREVKAYQDERAARLEQAAALEAQAKGLAQQAKALREQ